ncbi:tripartite tricarboxylate transporter substrate binding protein [Variovorax sp. J22R133]|uniref:Bug family tripartite tricarboxylate transporter substrate binding protein n=1 Tax=Variovorax brevis TaxID=3053503 RepID=UPI002575DC07|nr:tripartite tricarboxylate transporter substrate binding protein [Variovorax sp. J22R133]MDM0113710.1 tripartite tricarboxylate transporter substrate binding protein [Variovorax sp. J22R133]
MNRRFAILASLGISASGLFAPFPSAAADYPDKPIRMIVPYAAGGGVDNIARVVATHLGARLKQPVIIDNRPGANANIGADAVAKAAPDGYTVLMGATFLAFNRATMKVIPYDASKDFVPVARTGKAPFVLVVPASSPFKTVAELVDYMKANPDKASYGAVGAGSPTNLIFPKNTGTNPVQVLYKGGAAAMPDLIAGRLTYMIQTTSEVLPSIASGKLRALAVSGSTRFGHLPSVPTMQEAGVKDLEGTGWWGVFAPARTPAAVVQRLSDEIQVVMKQPDVAASLDKLGIEPAPMPAATFAPFFQTELKSYVDVARQFNLTAE